MSVIHTTGTLSKTVDGSVPELPLRSPRNLVDHSVEETTIYSPPPPYKMQLSVTSPSQPTEDANVLLEGQITCTGEGNTWEGQTRGNSLGADNLETKTSGILYQDKHEKLRHSGCHRWSLDTTDTDLTLVNIPSSPEWSIAKGMRPLSLPSRLQQSSFSISNKSKMANKYTLPRHRPPLGSTYSFMGDKEDITGDRMVRCQRGVIKRARLATDFKSKRKAKEEQIHGAVLCLPPDIGLGLSSESDTESEASFHPPIPIPSDVSFALSSLADFLSPSDPPPLLNPKDKKDSSSISCLQAPGSPSKGSEKRMTWTKNMEARLEADSEGNVSVARLVPSATSSTSTGWLPLFLSFFIKRSQHRSKPPKPTPAPNIPLHILLLFLQIISTITRGIKHAVLTGVKVWVVMEVVWRGLDTEV
ncbi:hypothetical protein C350_04203 [Cryptococcus neoformans MW-RSA36]|nr:hypothetical protein C350_04203 [Cryptococcus neoformans var. grubii MW-RSA36]